MSAATPAAGAGSSSNNAQRYEKVEQIGSGTFGSAWLVKSRASGRLYVVKEIKVTSLPEHEREQSVNEVAILSQCKHVNIIRYKEAFIEHGTGSLNIVMEYADGGDLYARILNQRARDDHFAEDLVLNWFIQITFAVQYLHSKNILHRDLKTQNIFLTRENLVKVGDFGIARTLRSTQELATTAIGTPYYLSPEICQRQPYNHKSDQWAVGCILYEMCCLTHPFNANSFENLVLKILQARYTPIPSQYSLLLRDLVTVLLRTLPERRPSAEQVLMIPALKPFVDSYVQWQNEALSSRGQTLHTDASVRVGSTAGSDGSDGSNGSRDGSSGGSNDPDASERDSLCSSPEAACSRLMSCDSLEACPALVAAPHSPLEANSTARRRSGRNSAGSESRPWRSHYANLVAAQSGAVGGGSSRRHSADRTAETSLERHSDRGSGRAVERRSGRRSEPAVGTEPASDRGEEASDGGGAHRRTGSPRGERRSRPPRASLDGLQDAGSSGADGLRPAEAPAPPPALQASVETSAQPAMEPGAGAGAGTGTSRARSHSVSSLSPPSPAMVGGGPATAASPAAGRVQARPTSARGPSSLIRQVLKSKFSRQEQRTVTRSASDPAQERAATPAGAAPRRHGSPARVFRRPSLTVARFTTPESRSSSRLGSRSRSPVPPPVRSPLDGKSSRVTPVRRNARCLDEPVARLVGAKIVKPVERQVAAGTPEVRAVAAGGGGGGRARAHWRLSDECSPDEGRAPPHRPNWAKTRPEPRARSGSSGHDSGHETDAQDSGQRASSASSERSSGVNAGDGAGCQDLVAEAQGASGERAKLDDNDAEGPDEGTLVDIADKLSDINHNEIKVSGGQLHRHGAGCRAGTCCALICAQCRYHGDEQLGRLMWRHRIIRPGGPELSADASGLIAGASQVLDSERVAAALSLLRARWTLPESSSGTMVDQLIRAVGSERVNMLPLLMQAVQLEMLSQGE